jgi:hypothetical protein
MKLTEMTPKEFCEATKACSAGREFALKYQSMNEVWEHCPKVDWLLWITDKTGRPDDRTLRIFAVWCARNTPLPDGRKTGNLITDPRSLAALDVAERFANGQASRDELDAARVAAWAAAWAAWDAARIAAWDAAWAAGAAAWAAAWAAWDAAWAAGEAWDAARAAAGEAWDAARAAGEADKAQATQFRAMVKNPFTQ